MAGSFRIKTVAVIGAGASGLVTAKYLISEDTFEAVTIFETRPLSGGLWNKQLSDLHPSPSTPSTTQRLAVLRHNETPRLNTYHPSPIYDDLEANIPHFMMQFAGYPFRPGIQLFPRWRDIRDYLHHYSSELDHAIKLNTQVQRVTRLQEDFDGWEVESKDLITGMITTLNFDAVVVANGHLEAPFFPEIDGLDKWQKLHPQSISHSKDFKNAEIFRDKKILVVGNSVSGLDISARVAKTCSDLIVSQKTKSSFYYPIEKAKEHPTVSRFLPTTRSVEFVDGTSEKHVDHIIFCTGYLYDFPFLSNVIAPEIVPSTHGPAISFVSHLYQHIFYIDHPTLAFVGIPEKTIPFPVAEAQASVIAKVWSNQVQLTDGEKSLVKGNSVAATSQQRHICALPFPKDMAYLNALCDWSELANNFNQKDEPEVDGHFDHMQRENAGVLKPSPHRWGALEEWVRPRIPDMKRAFNKLEEFRHSILSAEDLRFSEPQIEFTGS